MAAMSGPAPTAPTLRTDMPNRPPKPCTRCGRPAQAGQSLCSRHLGQMRARGDAKRGTSTQRGYGARHESVFRAGVFEIWGTRCVAPVGDPGDSVLIEKRQPLLCNRRAIHADHYPRSRRELEAAGLDPDDPQHGRPLCPHHHNKHTGQTQGRLAKGNKK